MPQSDTKDPCPEACQSMPDCTWYSRQIVDPEDSSVENSKCLFFSYCESLNFAENGRYKSSQKECDMCESSDGEDSCSAFQKSENISMRRMTNKHVKKAKKKQIKKRNKKQMKKQR